MMLVHPTRMACGVLTAWLVVPQRSTLKPCLMQCIPSWLQARLPVAAKFNGRGESFLTFRDIFISSDSNLNEELNL